MFYSPRMRLDLPTLFATLRLGPVSPCIAESCKPWACWSAPDPQIHEWLERHIAAHQPLLDTIVHPELPAQVAMLLLRLSVVPLLGYLTRVIRPSLLAPHAKRFDEMVLDTAQRKFALPSPLPDAAVLTLTQPIRSGGFGLSKAAAVSVPAYFCALSAAPMPSRD